jgi:L-amino acid N-acyltransferase YncA
VTAVRAIYEDGIRDGNATLETEAPEWDAWEDEGDVVLLERRSQVVGTS